MGNETETMELTKEYVGDLNLQNGLVDITDPCYDADVWCRENNVKVKPGIYECNSYISDDYRAMILTIHVKDDQETIDKINDDNSWQDTGMVIGVDAGLAGFFQSPKPDFSLKEWIKMCDLMCSENVIELLFSSERFDHIVKFEGVWSRSGYGDGKYAVYAIKNSNDEITALELRF